MLKICSSSDYLTIQLNLSIPDLLIYGDFPVVNGRFDTAITGSDQVVKLTTEGQATIDAIKHDISNTPETVFVLFLLTSAPARDLKALSTRVQRLVDCHVVPYSRGREQVPPQPY